MAAQQNGAAILESMLFQAVVLLIVLVDLILTVHVMVLGEAAREDRELQWFGHVILIALVLELSLRVFVERIQFFKSGLNVFEFIVVVCCVVNALVESLVPVSV